MCRTHWHRGTVLVLSILAAACGSDRLTAPVAGPPAGAVASESRDDGSSARKAVLSANAQIAVAEVSLVPPGAPLPPFVEARLYAIASVAMHDALNAVRAHYGRYADTGPADRDANAAAAVLTAAHDAINGADPGAIASTDAWYAASIAGLSGEEGVADGIAIGRRAAAAILARRAADGTAGGAVGPYHPGPNPGDYQFTFPFNTAGFDFFHTGGFADASLWGATVTPFVVQRGSQFRAPPPYGAASNAEAVLTPRYTRDFDEVKALGCAACSARTAEQTEIARFWAEDCPAGWNRIAVAIAMNRELDAYQTARLLAMVAMGEFDSYVTSLESKYHYNFWRPVTAVAMAGSDGNPATSPAAGWQVLVFPTPPVPDYPSAHASAGATAAAIIEALVPDDDNSFSASSRSLTGVTRTFASPHDAAIENAASRVYIGYHFRYATEAGMRQGTAIGRYTAAHALRPVSREE